MPHGLSYTGSRFNLHLDFWVSKLGIPPRVLGWNFRTAKNLHWVVAYNRKDWKNEPRSWRVSWSPHQEWCDRDVRYSHAAIFVQGFGNVIQYPPQSFPYSSGIYIWPDERNIFLKRFQEHPKLMKLSQMWTSGIWPPFMCYIKRPLSMFSAVTLLCFLFPSTAHCVTLHP